MPVDITLVNNKTILPSILQGEAYKHTVTCAIFSDEGVLILIRNDGKNELMGGHIEELDAGSSLNAVMREVEEETGLVSGLNLTQANFELKALSRYGKNLEKTNWIFFCQLRRHFPIEYVVRSLDTHEHKDAFWATSQQAKSGILINGVNKHHEIFVAIP